MILNMNMWVWVKSSPNTHDPLSWKILLANTEKIKSTNLFLSWVMSSLVWMWGPIYDPRLLIIYANVISVTHQLIPMFSILSDNRAKRLLKKKTLFQKTWLLTFEKMHQEKTLITVFILYNRIFKLLMKGPEDKYRVLHQLYNHIYVIIQ